MKKDAVKIGAVYMAKVSGKLCKVKITGDNRFGGWDALNVETNRTVRVKSGRRLSPVPRPKVVVKGAAKAKAATATQTEKAPKATRKATGETKRPTGERGARGGKRVATSKADAVDAAMKAVDANKKSPTRHSRYGDGAKRMSGLDAAAQVLKDAKEPLTTKAMVERMLAKGLWQTGGKTPAATIYAAIIREIAAKGKESRFTKVDKGKFALAK